MTPKMLIQELQQKLDNIAVNLSDFPRNSDDVDTINNNIEDVIIDLECVRDYLKVKH